MSKVEVVSIEFPAGTSNNVHVTFLGPKQLRIEEDPLSCLMADDMDELRTLPDFRDVFEVEKLGENSYRFVKVTKRARFQRFQCILSDPDAQTRFLEPVLSRVMELGGEWERVFGGVLTIFVPPGCDYDVEAAVDSEIKGGYTQIVDE